MTPWPSPTRASPAPSSATPPPPRPRTSPTPSPPRSPRSPPGPRCSAKERAAKMTEAIAGIADDRDADAAILSQENGKVRHGVVGRRPRARDPLEPGPDAGRRGRHGQDAPRRARDDPGRDDRGLPAARRRHRHRAVQLADRDPRRRPPPRAAGRKHRDREAAALGAAGHHARRAAHRREAAPRACSTSSPARTRTWPASSRTPTSPRCASPAASTAASGSWRWRPRSAHPCDPRARRQRRGGVPRGRDHRRRRTSTACTRRSTTPPARSA